MALVRPFAQFLADTGAPVEREFRKAGLPILALEDVDNYIPSQRFWAFLVNVARSEGMEDFGYRVGRKYAAGCIDPRLTSRLRRAPTLYQGLLISNELTKNTVSRSHVGLLQPPLGDHTYWYHRPSCDRHNPAIHQIGLFGLMTFIGIVRMFAGAQWQPTEIALMTRHIPCRCLQNQFPGTRIRLSQACSYITLENALLSRPPLTYAAAAPVSSLRYEPLQSDFIGSLKKILHTYIQDGDLGVEQVAEMCNTSARSLQRKLKGMGTSYCEMLNQVRFHVASERLKDPDVTVTDDAHLLGYSEPTHFSRAFRRIAGVTPRAYRQVHLQ
jgi:AraC-like DNA-binding protein